MLSTGTPRSRFARLIALLALLLMGAGLAAVPSSAEDAGGVPTTPRLDSVSLAAGGSHSCVVVTSGQLRCWGKNLVGQLGQGNTNNVGDNPGESSVSVDLGAGRTATAVSLGFEYSCAITDLGSVRCWGLNNSGQLGQGNTTQVGDNAGETTVPVPAIGNATAIAAGNSHACAIVNGQFIRCWGRNTEGELGQGNTVNVGTSAGDVPVLVDLGPAVTASAITGGFGHTCAITGTGQVRCWGYNSDGQLGQGNTATVGDNAGEHPVGVNLGPGRTALAVSAGDLHTCAITDLGTVLCWGGTPSDSSLRATPVLWVTTWARPRSRSTSALVVPRLR